MNHIRKFSRLQTHVSKMQRICLDATKQTRFYSTGKVEDINESNMKSISLENEPKPISYKVCDLDYHWVEEVLPPSKIPYPLKHEFYPTPSGWYAPPDDTVEHDKDYFIQRTKYHVVPVTEERVDLLNDWVTKIENVSGNLNMLREDLVEVLKPHCENDPAISIDEVNQTVLIRGAYLSIIEQFLYENKF